MNRDRRQPVTLRTPVTGGGNGIDQTPTVTRLLARLKNGDADALDEIFALVYDELHALAGRQRRRWHGNDTLNTTALVHEAYVKLVVGRTRVDVESRGHFFALAARAMRQILCNYARDRGARKRGGGLERLGLDGLPPSAHRIVSPMDTPERLLALDAALRRLEQSYPRQSKVVECRFFGGLTVDETAAALGIAPRTVKRDWALAQAWLHRELETPRDR